VQYPPPPPVFDNSVNDTIITWQDGPSAPAGTHYEIVWRPTAAADWQRSVTADKAGAKHEGDTWSVTLPISKDNVIFAVRSIDAAGHRSPAVVPMPATRPHP
jgi:hypothetical protein